MVMVMMMKIMMICYALLVSHCLSMMAIFMTIYQHRTAVNAFMGVMMEMEVMME